MNTLSRGAATKGRWLRSTEQWRTELSLMAKSKEIQPVHPKGNQSWVFIARTDAEAETPILWPPYAKSWLNGKDPDARRDWGQEKKGTTEDEIAGWHHQLDGHEFEWTPGVSDGQAWRAMIHGVAKSRTRLSDWTELKEQGKGRSERKVLGINNSHFIEKGQNGNSEGLASEEKKKAEEFSFSVLLLQQ